MGLFPGYAVAYISSVICVADGRLRTASWIELPLPEFDARLDTSLFKYLNVHGSGRQLCVSFGTVMACIDEALAVRLLVEYLRETRRYLRRF